MFYLCCCFSRPKPTQEKPVEEKSKLMEESMKYFKEDEQLLYDSEYSPDPKIKEIAKRTLQIRMSIRH